MSIIVSQQSVHPDVWTLTIGISVETEADLEEPSEAVVNCYAGLTLCVAALRMQTEVVLHMYTSLSVLVYISSETGVECRILGDLMGLGFQLK